MSKACAIGVDVGEQIVVTEHHPLGISRGTRGVLQQGQPPGGTVRQLVVAQLLTVDRVHAQDRQRQPLATGPVVQTGLEACGGQHRRRARVLGDRRDSAVLVREAAGDGDGDGDPAGVEAAEERRGEGVPERQTDQDPVPLGTDTA
jgi:hypothetical protein